jgi:predicted AAA+ superfamily ATPase
LHPGGLWNEAEMSREFAITRPTVSKYLAILEQAFLVFRLPNLANAVRGQPKVYLVAPALRQALLGLDDERVREPQEWGLLAENVVASTAMSMREAGSNIGFWRTPRAECDVVVLRNAGHSELIEIKRSGQKALLGIHEAARDLDAHGNGWVLGRDWKHDVLSAQDPPGLVLRTPLSLWLYTQRHDQLGAAVPRSS